MSKGSRRFQFRRKRNAGLSLIEVMFAIAILGVGLCALMAMIGNAVYSMKYAQEDQISKQKAREAMEAVISARNDTSISFDDLQNVSSGGIFKDGFQSLYLAGSNGLPGTGQDTTTLDRIVLPGPDGQIGTSDDVLVALTNYQRQILISKVFNSDGSLNTDLRKLAVTVRVYSAARGNHDYTLTAFISRFN
jgi:prepilin-type N-terminal cleavage/methylation domain-containing protein